MKHRVGLDGAARNLGFLSIVCQHRKSCRQFVVLILCGHWLVSSVLAMAVVAPPAPVSYQTVPVGEFTSWFPCTP